ncbi:unnamed protein product [Spirodela intermedia]|uniref:FLZ-type domain-containing protein n=1 Tax=Spirodela intermedia TaxID=51605 RepID=A0A7I8J7U8_SPIIN|nr:unnamed protein product [Spirodela intermedia]CAA6666267.1 unnamed protein product [Spirodela intermedia]
MLRKRSRPAQKESTSFFNLPGLFVGFSKGTGDSDSARSPISPLDLKVFSGLSGHFGRSPRSPASFEGPRKSWDSDRVGLGLIDSLSDKLPPCRGPPLLGPSESRSILLGSQMKIISIPSPRTRFDHLLSEGSATSPKSLPKNYVISSHLGGPPPHRRLLRRLRPLLPGFVGSLSASDIEQSEDYTCIISHGPNPKTTHIFGDCILESDTSELAAFIGDTNMQGEEERRGSSWMLDCAEDLVPLPSEDFLSVCYSCKKKLDGKDIYMYRGEKAFCSSSCRSQEIMDEEMEEEPATASSGSSPQSTCSEEVLPAPHEQRMIDPSLFFPPTTNLPGEGAAEANASIVRFRKSCLCESLSAAMDDRAVHGFVRRSGLSALAIVLPSSTGIAISFPLFFFSLSDRP